MSNIVDKIVEEPAKYALPFFIVIAAIVFFYQLGKVNETNEKIAIQLGSIDKKLRSFDEKFVDFDNKLGDIDRAIIKVLGSRYSHAEVDLSTIDRKLRDIETAIRFKR